MLGEPVSIVHLLQTEAEVSLEVAGLSDGLAEIHEWRSIRDANADSKAEKAGEREHCFDLVDEQGKGPGHEKGHNEAHWQVSVTTIEDELLDVDLVVEDAGQHNHHQVDGRA